MAGPCRPTNDTLPASDRLTPLGENSSVSPCVERTVQSPAFTASDLERLRYWTSTKRPPYPTADAPTTMQPMPETRWLRQLSELSVGGGSWCWSAINPIHATSSLSSVQVSSNAAPAALLPMGAE